MASVPQSKNGSKKSTKRARYFFRGDSQRRAIDYLRYALEKGRGAFALHGPAGVGKTVVARQVIREWKANADAAVLLPGERVGGNGVYRLFAGALGLNQYSMPQPEIISALESNFSTRLSKGGRSLLIIDDADHLRRVDLDELAVLCELQKSGHPLLQVFLIGRRLRFTEPELRGKPGGIAHLIGSYQLAPLGVNEVADFIAGWGEYEGYKELARLSPAQCERVAEWSEGRPRKLTRFCEQARGILAKGRGLVWDNALIERLVAAANDTFLSVQPPSPPVDYTVGGTSGTLSIDSLQSGPNVPVKNKLAATVAEDAAASTQRAAASADAQAKLVLQPQPPTPPTKLAALREAITTPLVAVCATIEEAYVLAPLVKALAKQIGKCTLLVEPGEINPERPPWNSRTQRVRWRAFDIARSAEPHHAGILNEALQRGSALMSNDAPKLFLSMGNSDVALGLALAAHKLGLRQVRVEAGRRWGGASKSDSMNQALLERLADCLLVSDSLTQVNLLMEGIQRSRVREVGNLRVDALASLLARDGVDFAQAADPERHGARGAATGCALVVLRDERTGIPGNIELLLRVLRDIGEMMPIRLLVSQALMDALHASEPVRQWRRWNIDMLALVDPVRSLELLVDARVVVTDSDFMQVEATALRVPCITLAEQTSWPITIESGSNRLCRLSPVEIIDAVTIALTEPLRRDSVPVMWDGQAAQRATHAVMALLAGERRSNDEGDTANPD